MVGGEEVQGVAFPVAFTSLGSASPVSSEPRACCTLFLCDKHKQFEPLYQQLGSQHFPNSVILTGRGSRDYPFSSFPQNIWLRLRLRRISISCMGPDGEAGHLGLNAYYSEDPRRGSRSHYGRLGPTGHDFSGVSKRNQKLRPPATAALACEPGIWCWQKAALGPDASSSPFWAAENIGLGMSSYHVLRGLWQDSAKGKGAGKGKIPSSRA